MKIDLINAQKVFLEYVNDFDKEDLMVNIKIDHTLRVAKNSEYISQNMGLSKEEIELATLIGYLHDIGRFEQIRLFGIDHDKKTGIDHAQKGVEELEKNNLLEKFIPNAREYDNLIKLAVFNHNKYRIQENLTERETLFCNLIRDADKLDIYYVLIDGDIYAIGKKSGFDPDSDKISPELLKDLFASCQSNNTYLDGTFLDWYINVIAFVYDINYSNSLELVLENKYIEILVEKVIKLKPDKAEIFNRIQEHLIGYIKDKISEN